MQIEDILMQFYPNISIKNFLDIGGGYGKKTKEVYEYCNGIPWILEGNAENNSVKNKNHRKAKWNISSNDFSYYHKFSTLKDYYIKKFPQVNLVDCDNIDIPDSIKFDLIFSNMSYGFHYPISTYYNFIKKYSNESTLLIVDIRRFRSKLKTDECFEILQTFNSTRKFDKCLIKLKERRD